MSVCLDLAELLFWKRNTHHSQGFPEEVVLAQDGDEEANKAFDCHGNESSSHNVPLKRRLHLVKLAWKHTFTTTLFLLFECCVAVNRSFILLVAQSICWWNSGITFFRLAWLKSLATMSAVSGLLVCEQFKSLQRSNRAASVLACVGM